VFSRLGGNTNFKYTLHNSYTMCELWVDNYASTLLSLSDRVANLEKRLNKLENSVDIQI